jgi:hypothetical protein
MAAQAQKTQRTVTVNGQVLPVPDDATTGTARAVVGITIPVVDPNTCTSTNNNCFTPRNPPSTGGASGSQCGLRSTGSRGELYTMNYCQGYDLLGTPGSRPVYYTFPGFSDCVGGTSESSCTPVDIPAYTLHATLRDGEYIHMIMWYDSTNVPRGFFNPTPAETIYGV